MNSHNISWVIVSDSNICRIFEYRKKPKQLNLLKEINHPENKLRNIDLTSDRPGHYKSSGSSHGAYSQPTDPKEIKIENFAREIANEIEQNRNNHAYDKLIIIAAPHMYGLLLKHFNQHIKKLIAQHIEKDLIHKSEKELLDILMSV